MRERESPRVRPGGAMKLCVCGRGVMLMRDREKRGRRMEERGKREWERQRIAEGSQPSRSSRGSEVTGGEKRARTSPE